MANFDWEAGLPSAADLTPLCQSLIPEDLAYAFKITSETPRTWLDVDRASHTTFSSLTFLQSSGDSDPPEEEVVGCGSDLKKSRRMEDDETIESCEGKPAKKARLVWTPQLHKRFVEVVGHLGLKNAVPKTIMQMMNVEGLSRENVASHLQKYRLYISRTQGLSDEGPSQSNQLFCSTPTPDKYSGSGNMNKGRNENNVAMENMNSLHHHHHHYHHYQQQQYGNMEQEQKSWSGNKYSTTTYSHHLTHNNK